jgi:hypothetical protein
MPPAHIGTGILCNACFHAAASCRAYRTTRIPWITRPPSALGRPPPTLDHDPAAGWITPWLPVKPCCQAADGRRRRPAFNGLFARFIVEATDQCGRIWLSAQSRRYMFMSVWYGKDIS